MNIKSKLKKMRDGYVIKQVHRAKLPEFASGKTIVRYRITFSGRVQKVGFRLEVTELAKRLGLTGFCENLENGDVLAELQGDGKKIWFLISFMESLKRIRIREKTVEVLEVNKRETAFWQK